VVGLVRSRHPGPARVGVSWHQRVVAGDRPPKLRRRRRATDRWRGCRRWSR
jgi:hypothetical protein